MSRLPACRHRGNPFSFSSAFSVDCLVPDCSGNGVCVAGRCVCFKGHQGSDCTLPDDMTVNICVNCSGHGVYDYSERVCHCEDGWGGATCHLGRSREGGLARVVSFDLCRLHVLFVIFYSSFLYFFCFNVSYILFTHTCMSFGRLH